MCKRESPIFVGKREAENQREKLQLEEEQERQIVDDLRRTARANRSNCLNPEIGSPGDRQCSKMAAKGLLVRTPVGYMLPEYVSGAGRSSRFASRFQ
jgi:hypothetical protein